MKKQIRIILLTVFLWACNSKPALVERTEMYGVVDSVWHQYPGQPHNLQFDHYYVYRVNNIIHRSKTPIEVGDTIYHQYINSR
jgi:hypothetical protein